MSKNKAKKKKGGKGVLGLSTETGAELTQANLEPIKKIMLSNDADAVERRHLLRNWWAAALTTEQRFELLSDSKRDLLAKTSIGTTPELCLPELRDLLPWSVADEDAPAEAPLWSLLMMIVEERFFDADWLRNILKVDPPSTPLKSVIFAPPYDIMQGMCDVSFTLEDMLQQYRPFLFSIFAVVFMARVFDEGPKTREMLDTQIKIGSIKREIARSERDLAIVRNQLQKCPICEETADKTCARCASVFYCSKDHQKQHWPLHKLACGVFQTKKLSDSTTPVPHTDIASQD